MYGRTHSYHGIFHPFILDEAYFEQVLDQFNISRAGAIPRHGGTSSRDGFEGRLNRTVYFGHAECCLLC